MPPPLSGGRGARRRGPHLRLSLHADAGEAGEGLDALLAAALAAGDALRSRRQAGGDALAALATLRGLTACCAARRRSRRTRGEALAALAGLTGLAASRATRGRSAGALALAARRVKDAPAGAGLQATPPTRTEHRAGGAHALAPSFGRLLAHPIAAIGVRPADLSRVAASRGRRRAGSHQRSRAAYRRGGERLERTPSRQRPRQGLRQPVELFFSQVGFLTS